MQTARSSYLFFTLLHLNSQKIWSLKKNKSFGDFILPTLPSKEGKESVKEGNFLRNLRCFLNRVILYQSFQVTGWGVEL